MEALTQEPFFYWLIWGTATLIGVVLGWSLRASWRERAILDAYDRSEQERNSVAHLYNQLRSQHEQKTAEMKRLSLESTHLRTQLGTLEIEQATRRANQEAEAAILAKSQAEATFAQEKVQLLEENIRFLRIRDQQFSTEISRLHEELQGWKKLQRDFSGMLGQIQELEAQNLKLQNERKNLLAQLDTARVEVTNLQNSLALTNAAAEGDSDQRDSSNPSGTDDDD